MPDPVSIVAAALSITSSAYTLCRSSSDLVSGIKNAPSHISRVSEDLHNFYPILRALESALRGIKSDSDGLIEDIGTVVHRSIQNCIHIFRDLTLLVNEYRSIEPAVDQSNVQYKDGYGTVTVGKWSAIKWEFRKKDIDALTVNLAQCKETCQLAVSSAHFIVSQSESKRVYRGLQKNNENLVKNYGLLKKVLKQVLRNDKSVSQDLVVASEDRPSTIGPEAQRDNDSDQLSQFLADVDSVLSSSPTSTPRMSMATTGLPLDDDLQSLRESIRELQNLPSHGSHNTELFRQTVGNHTDSEIPSELSVEETFFQTIRNHKDSEIPSEPSAEESLYTLGANEIPASPALSEIEFIGCVKKEVQAKVNLALQVACSAPPQIQHLRHFAKRYPGIAQDLLHDYSEDKPSYYYLHEQCWTSMFLAAALGRVEDVKEMWSTKPQNWVPDGGISTFQLVTICEDYDLVVWLLERNALVDSKNWEARTPLQNAIIRNDIRMIEILLSAGADLHREDNLGNTARDLAKTHNKPQILRTLISHSYPWSKSMGTNNERFSHPTLLHCAILHCNIPGIRWLLERGCSSVAAMDFAGRTPLHLAVMTARTHGTLPIKLLLKNKAHPNKPDFPLRNTSLHIAALCDLDEVYELLKAAGGDVNLQNRDGFSPSELFEKPQLVPYCRAYSENLQRENPASMIMGRFF